MTAPSASGGSEHKPAAGPSWRELAFTDPLTGLPNRRRLDEVIENYIDGRTAFYAQLIAHDPIQQVFSQGWKNRITALEKFIERPKK